MVNSPTPQDRAHLERLKRLRRSFQTADGLVEPSRTSTESAALEWAIDRLNAQFAAPPLEIHVHMQAIDAQTLREHADALVDILIDSIRRGKRGTDRS